MSDVEREREREREREHEELVNETWKKFQELLEGLSPQERVIAAEIVQRTAIGYFRDRDEGAGPMLGVEHGMLAVQTILATDRPKGTRLVSFQASSAIREGIMQIVVDAMCSEDDALADLCGYDDMGGPPGLRYIANTIEVIKTFVDVLCKPGGSSSAMWE